jgi:hypothetical protein
VDGGRGVLEALQQLTFGIARVLDPAQVIARP